MQEGKYEKVESHNITGVPKMLVIIHLRLKYMAGGSSVRRPKLGISAVIRP